MLQTSEQGCGLVIILYTVYSNLDNHFHKYRVLYPDSVSEAYSRMPLLAKKLVKLPLIVGSFEPVSLLFSALFSIEYSKMCKKKKLLLMFELKFAVHFFHLDPDIRIMNTDPGPQPPHQSKFTFVVMLLVNIHEYVSEAQQNLQQKPMGNSVYVTQICYQTLIS